MQRFESCRPSQAVHSLACVGRVKNRARGLANGGKTSSQTTRFQCRRAASSGASPHTRCFRTSPDGLPPWFGAAHRERVCLWACRSARTIGARTFHLRSLGQASVVPPRRVMNSRRLIRRHRIETVPRILPKMTYRGQGVCDLTFPGHQESHGISGYGTNAKCRCAAPRSGDWVKQT